MDNEGTLVRSVRFGAMQRLGSALALAIAAYLAQPDFISWHTRVVASWDLGAIVYLALAWWLITRTGVEETRDHALAQDQSSYLIFLFVVGAACASIVAIGFIAGTTKELAFWPKTWHLTLTVAALISSWLLIQTVFAFHYARRYYDRARRDRAEPTELVFPGSREPDYLDFAYYSFVIGMTSQVSDVAATSRRMRRLTLVHSFLSFVFNIAVLALSINIIASVG
jgi:uncharacterized membrane protein